VLNPVERASFSKTDDEAREGEKKEIEGGKNRRLKRSKTTLKGRERKSRAWGFGGGKSWGYTSQPDQKRDRKRGRKVMKKTSWFRRRQRELQTAALLWEAGGIKRERVIR